LGCAGNSVGSACVAASAGGTCGCAGAGDCPGGVACDLVAHSCTVSCSGTQPCSGACCSNGTCALGTAVGACGLPGDLCSDCSASTDGHQCLGNRCGCDVSADCPSGRACDTSTHRCTTSCGPSQRCRGGCCQAGTCAAGQAS